MRHNSQGPSVASPPIPMPPMEWHVLSSGGGTVALDPSPWASSVAMEDVGFGVTTQIEQISALPKI